MALLHRSPRYELPYEKHAQPSSGSKPPAPTPSSKVSINLRRHSRASPVQGIFCEPGIDDPPYADVFRWNSPPVREQRHLDGPSTWQPAYRNRDGDALTNLTGDGSNDANPKRGRRLPLFKTSNVTPPG